MTITMYARLDGCQGSFGPRVPCASGSPAPWDTASSARALVPDWQTAAVVAQIFTWRADHRLGFAAITQRLNSDPRRYPTPAQTGRWSAKAIRRIVTNVKYTGRQVWAHTVTGRPVPVK